MSQSNLDLFKEGQKVEAFLQFNSVYELMKSHAENYSDKEAVVFVDADHDKTSSFSYSLLLNIVCDLAAKLKKDFQLKEGDAVALHTGNTPELLFLHFACWISGFVTVPLDLKRDTLDRKIYKIGQTGVKVVAGEEGEETEGLLGKLPKLKFLNIADIDTSNGAKDQTIHSVQDDREESSLDSTVLILFTSGTTALPKGVELSSKSIFLNADGIAEWLKITSEDRFFIILPLHHINSTTMSMATILRGGTVILCSRYTKSNFFKIIAENKCTLSSIVPTICLDMLSEQEQFAQYRDQLELTRIQIGSAPVVPTDVVKFLDLYSIPLVQGYGSTETALRVSGIQNWDGDQGKYLDLVKSNTIGSELKWNNLAVLKPDGAVASEGEVGEICIRGPILCKGYLHNGQATDEAFYDGWFHSGDVGFWKNINGEKQYFITGRSKEIIIKGGVNISPLTIEDALLKTFPEIKTCFVVGVADHRFGEELAAVIVLHDHVSIEQSNNIITKIKQNHKTGEIEELSKYETPQYIYVVKEESLPKTSTGKIQRVNIKQYLKEIHTPIAETEKHIFRKLTPFDNELIEQLIKIHNQRWGGNLAIDMDTANEAVQNGIVLAVIEKETGKLVGGEFAFLFIEADLINKVDYLQTYDKAAANLTLKTHNPEGDALMLVSIATEGRTTKESFEIYDELLKKSDMEIERYVHEGHDTVIEFHKKPKGGIEVATVFSIIKGGRPSDKAAMGYNVIMEYPELAIEISINEEASIGTQLIEAALKYASDNQIKKVYAYSRPAGFYEYLKAN
jgi:long-chain acyl-CoA synthetase